MRKSHTVLRAAFAVAVAAPTLTSAQFYGDPPDETHPWAVHDLNRPQPAIVTPGENPGDPPSDAIVLFDGSEASFENWVHEKDDRKSDWIIKDGVLQCTPGAGYIKTKAQLGDCQLHLEWAAPAEVKGNGQGRGNSGVFLMGTAEVQVLDNYNNPSYPDGMAGSVYGVMPPAANPLRKPGEWQTYDIIFRRPIIRNGKLLDAGSMTVLVNGVVVQDATPLEGGGGHKRRSNPNKAFPEKAPLRIQDHGNPVRFRNIWYRPLRKRAVDGGTDGQLSPEATKEKRAQIAADIRNDAASKQGNQKLLRLLESLQYEMNNSAFKEANAMLASFVKSVEATPKNQIQSRKKDTEQIYQALKFLTKFKILPSDTPAYKELGSIIQANGWKIN